MLKQKTRSTDFLARFGGEEFCIVLLNLMPEEAFRRMEAIRKTAESLEIPFGDKIIRLTMSIGLACEFGESLEHMIKCADERLYRAKQDGRNRVIGYD